MTKPIGLFHFVACGLGLLVGPVLYSSVQPGGMAANAHDILGVLSVLLGAAVVCPRNRLAAVRDVYGSDDLDGLMSFLAEREVWAGPNPNDGPKLLCRKICDTLIFAGLTGPAKAACRQACYRAASCDNLAPGVPNVGVVVQTCVWGTRDAEQCDRCCERACPSLRLEVFVGKCLGRCGYECNLKMLGNLGGPR